MFFNYRYLFLFSFGFKPAFDFIKSCVQFRLFSPSQPRTVWHKASAQSGVTSIDFSASPSFSPSGSKIFSHYIIFRTPTQSTRSLLLLSNHPHQLTWHFRRVLFSLRHRCTPCFDIHVTYAAYQQGSI